jgi:uncharacterized protein (TIGR00255 family)
MIKSMTGFGKAECILPNKKIVIEIKSLNSKQLDVNTRIPNLYKSKDIEIRKEISSSLVRGKVELNFYVENLGEESNSVINDGVVGNYLNQLQKIGTERGIPVTDRFLQIAVNLPDSVKIEREKLNEDEWTQIIGKVREALKDLTDFRIQEGKALEDDVNSNIKLIIKLMSEVDVYEEERLVRIKERIMNNLQELNGGESMDNNRFEQEMIYYLEKLDVNEEKVRLANHCEFFLENLNSNEPVGKKLGFIGQEIGREINTLGSKANHAEIQKIVIQMKDALERVKEQVLNVL